MKKFNRFSECAVQMIGVGVLALAVDLPAAHAQPQPFTLWQGGSSQWGAQGIYPAQPGQAGYPGARTAVQAARDAQGNLWMYGGTGYGNSSMAERLPDLWNFDAASSTWLWMGGMPDDTEANYPAAHGGEGRPGDRMDGAFWVDNDGNVWMFGGAQLRTGDEYGHCNDLWRFSPASNEWRWVSGSDAFDSLTQYPAAHGEVGYPGSRYEPLAITIKDGGLWMFGGYGYGATAPDLGHRNDLWGVSLCHTPRRATGSFGSDKISVKDLHISITLEKVIWCFG